MVQSDDEAWLRSYESVVGDPERLKQARGFLAWWAFLNLARAVWWKLAVLALLAYVLLAVLGGAP